MSATGFDPFLPISRQLQNATITELIVADDDYRARNDELVSWYHPTANRRSAEQKLADEYDRSKRNGCFLIRPCSQSNNDLTLSVFCNGVAYHYRLAKQSSQTFTIDNVKTFFGVEEIIRYFRDNKGLACMLTDPVLGEPVPFWTRAYGINSILHKASSYGNIDVLDSILRSPRRGDINERDYSGSTALHIASAFGHGDAVEKLINAGADVCSVDPLGRAPLHRAVESNNPSVSRTLIEAGACVNCMDIKGLTPLHQAGKANSFACVTVLLQYGSPIMPRDFLGKIPLDYALENHATESVKALSHFQPTPSLTKQDDWLHPVMSKEEAKALMIKAGGKDGTFLVRTRTTRPLHVLSVMYMGDCYNYQIFSEHGEYFGISEGPIFPTLDSLIDHYLRSQDRLITKLDTPVSSNPSTKTLRKPYMIGKFNSFRTKIAKPNISTTSSMSSTNINGAAKHKYMDVDSYQSSIDVQDDLSKVARYVLDFNNFSSRATEQQQRSRSSPVNSNIAPVLPITQERLKVIAHDQIHLLRQLGEGEFGVVYEGTYNADPSWSPIAVAVKKLKSLSDSSAVTDFKREADIMANLNHHCIVKIHGMVDDGKSIMMIQELLPYGSALNMLRNKRDRLTIDHLKKWIIQIADAMQYMESKNFVHRDLAARNVLLASLNQVKVSDFGLSRSIEDDIYEQHSEGKIPVKWYAIEAIEMGRFSNKSDVWSFGVTVWEIFNFGEEPYAKLTGVQVYNHIKKGKRLKRPKACPLATFKMVEKCWLEKESKRPSFDNLFNYFCNDSNFKGLIDRNVVIGAK